MHKLLLLLSASVFLGACGSDEASEPPPAPLPDASTDVGQDVQPDVADEPQPEATPDVLDDVQPDAPDPTAACAELNLASKPFVEASDDPTLYATAADITVPTTEGDWNLKQRWSGCDVYLFIQDVPRQEQGWDTGIWERDVEALFDATPRNVHFFFIPTAEDTAAIDQSLDALKQKVDTALADLPPEDQTWWTDRVHYVTQTDELLGGWLGDIMASPGWGAGIDRSQRIRYIGSYADPKRFDEGEGWFAPNLSMVANEAVYYNFEAERESTLDASDTVISLFDAAVGADALTVDVELPDAAQMAEFDTLELDLKLGCQGVGELGACPEWDRIVTLYLCDELDPTQCNTEIGRWITTYHREGRWVHDVSPLLPLLAEGGTRRFVFSEQDPWEVTLQLRLSDQGKPDRATLATPLFTSNEADGFDENYNSLHEPVTVSVPASAKRVEIASMITGHGMSMPGNCAEFCNTTHHFLVNGEEYVREFEDAGSLFGCMDQVSEGTVPNQYGTWWYGRSGWCPGKEVPLVPIDVTASAVAGADVTIDLEAYYNGSPYTGDNWRYIQHSSWLVIYE